MPASRRLASDSPAVALAVAALLAAVTAAVYAPVAGHDYAGLDDREFLLENRALDAGLSAAGVRHAFTTTLDGNWIPLTWLSFLADQELHGLAPGRTHATNAALHALATALLFLALRRLTGDLGPSAFTAAVFALHPLHVESVAWAFERKDVLSAVFFGAALWAWAGFARRGGGGRYALALGLAAAGLMAKPMLVTLPCVLLLLDLWPLRRLGSAAQVRRAVAEKLPFFALAAAASVVTALVQSEAGSMDLARDLPLGARAANALVSAAVYLRKAVWPVDLALFYPHPGDSLPALQVGAAAALLAALTALALIPVRRRPYLLVGWLWYLGMLVPVIGLVQVGVQAMADRYTYLPLVGVTVAVAWAGAEWAARGRAERAVTIGVALVLLAACVGVTRKQLGYWQDEVVAFERALAVHEANPVAHAGLGFALLERGRVEDARRHLERAVALEPRLADAHVNLGVALVRSGEPEAALPHLHYGTSLAPRRAARAQAFLGLAEQRLGRPERAVGHLRRALAGGEQAPELRLALAGALLATGRAEAAARELAAAEAALGETAEGHALAARVARAAGDEAEAARRYRRALALRPGWAAAANNLAWLLATAADPSVRDPVAAADLAEAAARAADDDPNVLDTLATALAAAGRTDEAFATARRAAALARERGDPALAAQIEAHAERWRGGRAAEPPGSR